MPDISIIVPTRGRPANASRLLEAVRAHSSAATEVVFGVDEDDPFLGEYVHRFTAIDGVRLDVAPRQGMCGTLNRLACAAAERSGVCSFLGDDHLPITPSFDARLLDAIDRMQGGIAYGNDLFQGENLPTAVWLSTPIVQALGWMAPPQLQHLFLDNFWKDLGNALGRLRYLPDVIVEHVHPQAGKAEWDAGYQRVNGGEMWQADETAYEAFRSSGEFDAAVERVREALR